MGEEQTKYLTWDAHNSYVEKVNSEFARRDDENERQNARISELETTVKQIQELVSSVKVLAVQMENMAKEQAKQGARLEAIEQKPTKRWDAVVTGLIGAIVGALGAALMTGLIH